MADLKAHAIDFLQCNSTVQKINCISYLMKNKNSFDIFNLPRKGFISTNMVLYGLPVKKTIEWIPTTMLAILLAIANAV